MTEISFHPNDKILSTLELAKNVGLFVFVISVFEGMFYAMYLEGNGHHLESFDCHSTN